MATVVAAQPLYQRALERDEVHYRARAVAPDGAPAPLLIVNITAMGMMARGDMVGSVGDRARIPLPVVGNVVAEIRWALGGRIGFAFPSPIATTDYDAVLGAMRR